MKISLDSGKGWRGLLASGYVDPRDLRPSSPIRALASAYLQDIRDRGRGERTISVRCGAAAADGAHDRMHNHAAERAAVDERNERDNGTEREGHAEQERDPSDAGLPTLAAHSRPDRTRVRRTCARQM